MRNKVQLQIGASKEVSTEIRKKLHISIAYQLHVHNFKTRFLDCTQQLVFIMNLQDIHEKICATSKKKFFYNM